MRLFMEVLSTVIFAGIGYKVYMESKLSTTWRVLFVVSMYYAVTMLSVDTLFGHKQSTFLEILGILAFIIIGRVIFHNLITIVKKDLFSFRR